MADLAARVLRRGRRSAAPRGGVPDPTDEKGQNTMATTSSGRRVRPDKQPASWASGLYGHPIHPILVTVPIGAWIASLVFDVASHVVDDGAETYSDGAELLIAIGIIGAVLAAIWGLIDYLRIERGTPAFKLGTTHLVINDVVLVMFVVSWIIRRNADDEATSAGLIVLSIVALALLSVSGWLGGKLAYRYGVRVADEDTQSEGFNAAGRG
jgi:uncharacterized membrane protein